MPVVASGDSLWKVAERHDKQGKESTVIYAANQKLIGGNPDRIPPGHELTIPRLGVE
jgi:nucleoid-associated protein YgaU